jgi:hypothetical protein
MTFGAVTPCYLVCVAFDLFPQLLGDEMQRIDRLILGALTVGVWALVAIQITTVTPAYADIDNLDQIDEIELTFFIREVVEKNCSADLGDGGKTHASINC